MEFRERFRSCVSHEPHRYVGLFDFFLNYYLVRIRSVVIHSRELCSFVVFEFRYEDVVLIDLALRDVLDFVERLLVVHESLDSFAAEEKFPSEILSFDVELDSCLVESLAHLLYDLLPPILRYAFVGRIERVDEAFELRTRMVQVLKTGYGFIQLFFTCIFRLPILELIPEF